MVIVKRVDRQEFSLACDQGYVYGKTQTSERRSVQLTFMVTRPYGDSGSITLTDTEADFLIQELQKLLHRASSAKDPGVTND